MSYSLPKETKREHFDSFYLKKFCLRHLDKFHFSPSSGAAGGLITVWNSTFFFASLVQANSYAITSKFDCCLNNSSFHLSNVYGPSFSDQKFGFVTWLLNLDQSDFNGWILAGDFNLYRSSDDRNKSGGNNLDMQMFNELIIDLDVTEIPFSGQRYTWSNMQVDPLLVKLDWVFTSASWNLSYPATSIQALSRPISNHTPYVINIGTKIPKAVTFRFENHWVEHEDFLKVVELHWNNAPFFANSARNLSQMLKQVRQRLRNWSKNFSNLGKLIHNCNWILLLDGLEEQSALSDLEWTLRNLTKKHLAKLLDRKKIY